MENALTLSLLEHCDAVIGIDEVGRGAWAGPVTVGFIRVARMDPEPVKGLKDSKQLSKVRREDLYTSCLSYADDAVTVSVPPQFIDVYGLTTALQEAVRRGVSELTRPEDTTVGILLDGTYNYLTTPKGFDTSLLTPLPSQVEYRVHLEPKLDGKDTTVAAAALIAKISRDHLMSKLDVEHVYGWEKNSGYGVASHIEAVKTHGLHPTLHRRRMKQWAKLGVAVSVPESQLHMEHPDFPPLETVVVHHPKLVAENT